MLTIAASSIPADFRGAAKRLDDIDIPRIAARISTGEDELRALMEVESRGHGFDKAGRPLILFEPHIFYRLLGKGAKRERAVSAGLAYPSWGQLPYPKDSYPRLIKAIEIDRVAALRSASWGLPQIMGDNFKAAGFSSVEEMVAAFCADEEHHVDAMVQFLKSSGLDDDLREHRWSALARGYNGPGYAKNAYHTRLAAAFARWEQKPDIDIRDAAERESKHSDGIADVHRAATHGATFVDAARIKAVQERLVELGYHMAGRPDGRAGPKTAGAIAAFQKENGFPVTGEITDELIEELAAAHPLEVAPDRAEGAPEGSRIVAGAKETVVAGGSIGITGALGVAGPLLDQVEEAKSFVERAKELVEPLRSFAAEYWPLIALALGVWVAVRGIGVIRARIEDHRSGKTA